jgi:hypothetical protein
LRLVTIAEQASEASVLDLEDEVEVDFDAIL